ncbi:MAG: hypothetical protein IKE17_14495 [Clostridia bacterium]|nr:hypothetical protein [Clostridia bacterium]
MPELKTDLDILDFISKQPDRKAGSMEIKAFIGDNASRRLNEMIRNRLVRCEPHWMDERLPDYYVDAKGEDLLATHEQRRQQVADQKAEAAREKAANDAKAVLDKKKSHRHDFKVAAFTVILTLFLEHISEIVNFIKAVFKAIGLFR